jgi:hypothetical protein
MIVSRRDFLQLAAATTAGAVLAPLQPDSNRCRVKPCPLPLEDNGNRFMQTLLPGQSIAGPITVSSLYIDPVPLKYFEPRDCMFYRDNDLLTSFVCTHGMTLQWNPNPEYRPVVASGQEFAFKSDLKCLEACVYFERLS